MHNPSFVQFIGLNPSTADETQDDPTVRRCINYAKAWGYGAMCMTNLFAFRATEPAVMKRQDDPIGDDNNQWLERVSIFAGLVVAAWGTHGNHMDRGSLVESSYSWLGVRLRCLKLTADGHPSHPLYLRGDLLPVELSKARQA